jgi:hypothetical protein
MSSQHTVINASGDYEESLQRLAKHLGKDKTRRAVFLLVYGRGSKPRSKKQIAEALGVTGTAQMVQNALDELARHRLITRSDNEGRVKDGSRYVYAKDDFVRANRDKVIRYADDPVAAKKLATKRTPVVSASPSFLRPKAGASSRSRQVSRSSVIPSSVRCKVALLVTNPSRAAPVQTGVEVRYIQDAIKLGGNPDKIDVKLILAPTIATLLDNLNAYKPQVLHFSGHAGSRSLVFDNERAGDDGGQVLDYSLVKSLIQATATRLDLLVLCGCDTLDGADIFLDVVPAVVAMSSSIDDEAACNFSKQFYRSISGQASLKDALTQAKLVLQHEGYVDAALPQLIVKEPRTAERTLV